MKYRAFLLLELLIALALFLILALALFSLGATLPRAVSSSEFRARALVHAANLIHAAALEADRSFGSLMSFATTSEGMYSLHRMVSGAEDEGYAEITAEVMWKNSFGSEKRITLHERVADASSTPAVCDPFVSGDWAHPLLSNRYTLASTDLLSGATTSQYSLGALAVTPSLLITGMASTSSRTAPTLFFFSLQGTGRPTLIASFDTASSSRIGVSSLAVSSSTVFAGTAFGSASAATCSDSISCAQVVAFSASTPSSQPIGKISLPTNSPPYARTISGATAAVRSLSHKNDYLFVGLEKTTAGYEFNIVDARDPTHLLWLSGLAVGHSVTGITVRDDIAYVATDDSQRELMLINVSDPLNPRLLSSWNALGANGFGYGAASTVRSGFVRFTRTYSPNGKEFQLIDARDPLHPHIIQEHDTGTSADPQSTRAIITQDWLSFMLLTRRLEFWNISTLDRAESFAAPYALPSGARSVALACRNEHLYLGYTLASGESIIEVLRGS